MKCCQGDYEYENGRAVFPKDEFGNEKYQVDKSGNELYPRKKDPFAKNRFGKDFYAKTVDGDELYPQRKKKCVVIREGGTPVVPRYASGRQRYPEDRRGNQYYLVDKNGELFPLRDENGRVYFARTNDGIEIVPLKYFSVAFEQNPLNYYRLGIDSAKNVVYVQAEKRRRRRLAWSFLCMLLIHVPALLSRLLEYLNG